MRPGTADHPGDGYDYSSIGGRTSYGMTRTPRTGRFRRWSPTRWHCWSRSIPRRSRARRPMRTRCWPSSLGRTWNRPRTQTGPMGGWVSPVRPRRTGSSTLWTRIPGTCIRPVPAARQIQCPHCYRARYRADHRRGADQSLRAGEQRRRRRCPADCRGPDDRRHQCGRPGRLGLGFRGNARRSRAHRSYPCDQTMAEALYRRGRVHS
jgi:hypothetical protein